MLSFSFWLVIILINSSDCKIINLSMAIPDYILKFVIELKDNE